MDTFFSIACSPITLIVWLVVGAIAGSLAHRLVGNSQSNSTVNDIVLGLIGAVVGGIILSFFDVGVRGNILSPIACIGHLMVATFGASVLILIGRAFSGKRAIS
jgi:uncharacterized membrane protein YeaQ/YmgE (transglycosylase-associated protein family)